MVSAGPEVNTESKGQSSAPFPIVGIGASAGGLAAVTRLLRALGAAPGLAVVLVQHLDPKHPSDLVELLARVALVPVEAASDGVVARADHVYVIPPGVALAIHGGTLSLTPRQERPGAHLPIDLFFDSLAADCGARAVGVVLSGTGADGSRGVQAIKAEGGVTFAQDEAEHAGMPLSAVATGSVDFLLPVDAIAAELTRIGSRKAAPAEEDAVDDEPSFRQILAAIRQRTGVDFTHYKPSTLRRRMQRRALLRNLGSLREYAEVVAAEPAEVEALSEEALIHVTSFFRDPDLFEALAREAFPRLRAGRGADSPIRVWVPGCSSGEEIFSIAIGLLEFLADAGASHVPVKLFGTDVSRRAIERARSAVYPESIAEEVTPGRLARFFVKTERGYEIRKDVRDRCVFATHDLTRDPPLSKMDLISCRNLMIYLGPALQQRIVPTLHYAMNEPGFLVLGPAETTGGFVGFTSIDAKNKIYARAPGPLRAPFEFGDVRTWTASPHAAVAPPDRVANISDVRKDADRAILAAVAPTGVVISDDLGILEFRGEIAPYLEPTPGTATLDLLRLAREEIRLVLWRAIDEARATGKRARRDAVPIGPGADRRSVDLEVVPFQLGPARFFAVLLAERPASGAPDVTAPPKDSAQLALEASLRQELGSTREYLQSVIEQLEAGNEELKAANEEIVSSNEELQSTNEELQTAKEELQATNEELRTVNDEMVDRNAEATRLAGDLTNVLSSVAIPIVILGRDSRIRRFTPSATKVLGLTASDVARPIGETSARHQLPDVMALVEEVLHQLTPVERSIQTEDGRWYRLAVRPYRTLDNRIDGTVLSIYDIDALKKSEGLLAEARDYAEEIIATMRECILVLDADLRVRSANRAFCEQFRTNPEDVQGQRLQAMDGKQWDVPELTRLTGALARGDQVEEARFERSFPQIGVRCLSANGRRMGNKGLILLALADITDRVRGERARTLDTERTIKDYQGKLQEMAFEATLAEERERRRLAQDLHDRVGQSLALARIKLEAVKGGAGGGEAQEAIAGALELIATSIEDTRTLTFELAPPVLYDLGLTPALSWFCEELERRTGIHVEIGSESERAPFDEATAAILFRSVRELLTNVVKYASVASARLTLARSGNEYEIVVEDAGAGFDPELMARRWSKGFGLFSVREQISRLGGTVDLYSRPGSGTRVRLRVPIVGNEPAPSSRGGGAHEDPARR